MCFHWLIDRAINTGNIRRLNASDFIVLMQCCAVCTPFFYCCSPPVEKENSSHKQKKTVSCKPVFTEFMDLTFDMQTTELCKNRQTTKPTPNDAKLHRMSHDKHYNIGESWNTSSLLNFVLNMYITSLIRKQVKIGNSTRLSTCFQCYDAVAWVRGRHLAYKKYCHNNSVTFTIADQQKLQ